ncbi:hypothetical protein Pint_15793 [Pistacia integerrima]|uniref:Uncharacterized protein n=1 Tax=Pistacia integerrima TaxID=434235 RepID=A0ACC0ZBN0_9ROSI|nr:hypothetical protein Pint_15793 [Pistacia integerrima]
MSFVGTLERYRGKGTVQKLLTALESDLISTNTLMFPTAVRLQKSLVPQPTDPCDADDNKLNRINDDEKVALPDLNLEPPEEDVN